MQIKIENLVKRYGNTTAVDGISFTAEEGKLTSLVGPSGCGKTTTLRSIAGLERPTSGKISIGNEVVTDPEDNIFKPPHKRDIGFVFQNFNAWPHMSVFENVAYPLRNRDWPEDEIEEKVMEALEMTGIEAHAQKQATDLSGGQQARVGICRAIVYEPKVLLFDEPLTGLDRNLRQKLRYEIKRIQEELGITSVYVTHSQPEAMTLSDKILLMNTNGKIEQQGSPKEIYYNPETQFTFDFFGSSESYVGTVGSDSVETAFGSLESNDLNGYSAGQELTVGFRPEFVEIGDAESWNENTFTGTVKAVSFLGEMYEIVVDIDGEEIRSRRRNVPEGIEEGREVTIHIDPENVVTYPLEARA